MNKQPKKVLVEYRLMETTLTFFDEKGDQLYRTAIHGFNRTTRYLHDLAIDAAMQRNGLYLWPAYPTGAGIFIGREG